MKENNNIITYPNFYAVLPAKIRYDQDLSSTAKIIYAEITALTNRNGYCFAKNKYLANIFNLNTRQVSNILRELANKKYIDIEIINNNIRKIYIINNEELNNNNNTNDERIELFEYDWLNEEE